MRFEELPKKRRGIIKPSPKGGFVKHPRKPSKKRRLFRLFFFLIFITLMGMLTLFSIRYPSTRIFLDNPTPITAPISSLEALGETKFKPTTTLTVMVKKSPASAVQVLAKKSCGTEGFTPGQCVWGVASWICVPQNMGSAYEWDDYARRNGYKVSSVPAVGAVAQSDKGGAGHVALVLAIKGDQIQIREMNFNYVPYSVRTRWVPVSSFEYLYF